MLMHQLTKNTHRMTLHVREAFEELQIPAPCPTMLTLGSRDTQVQFSATRDRTSQTVSQSAPARTSRGLKAAAPSSEHFFLKLNLDPRKRDATVPPGTAVKCQRRGSRLSSPGFTNVRRIMRVAVWLPEHDRCFLDVERSPEHSARGTLWPEWCRKATGPVAKTLVSDP